MTPNPHQALIDARCDLAADIAVQTVYSTRFCLDWCSFLMTQAEVDHVRAAFKASPGDQQRDLFVRLHHALWAHRRANPERLNTEELRSQLARPA